MQQITKYKNIHMKPIILFLLAAITLTSCTNYGKKVKKSNIEVYYNDGITEDQAQKLLILFIRWILIQKLRITKRAFN